MNTETSKVGIVHCIASFSFSVTFHEFYLGVTQTVNEQGDKETRVGTVDLRSSPGQTQETRPLEVVHKPHPGPATTGGVLADAAAAVADTLQSARDVISQK